MNVKQTDLLRKTKVIKLNRRYEYLDKIERSFYNIYCVESVRLVNNKEARNVVLIKIALSSTPFKAYLAVLIINPTLHCRSQLLFQL